MIKNNQMTEMGNILNVRAQSLLLIATEIKFLCYQNTRMLYHWMVGHYILMVIVKESWLLAAQELHVNVFNKIPRGS